MLLVVLGSVCVATGLYSPQAIGNKNWESVDLELENRYGAPIAPRLPSNVALNETRIFVGVAAFREHRCGRTLFDAYSKAVNPRRVFFGVVDQLLESAEDQFSCLSDYCTLMKDALAVGSHPHLNRLDAAERATAGAAGARSGSWQCLFANQIRVNRQNAFYSRGPTYARHLQQLLLRDEPFCLQIDAHTLFAPRWDAALLDDWLLLRNEFAVLTTYLPHVDQIDVQEPDDSLTQVVPHICKTVIGGGGMERNAIASAARSLPRPKLIALWGAGLSFSKCHAEVVVPYDPQLDHVFDGEEFSRALRLFTWGYDTYTPHRNRVFHDYAGVRAHWKVPFVTGPECDVDAVYQTYLANLRHAAPSNDDDRALSSPSAADRTKHESILHGDQRRANTRVLIFVLQACVVVVACFVFFWLWRCAPSRQQHSSSSSQGGSQHQYHYAPQSAYQQQTQQLRHMPVWTSSPMSNTAQSTSSSSTTQQQHQHHPRRNAAANVAQDY